MTDKKHGDPKDHGGTGIRSDRDKFPKPVLKNEKGGFGEEEVKGLGDTSKYRGQRSAVTSHHATKTQSP